MIIFPDSLTPVPKCPGYFWDTSSHKLYSIKIGGVLRELSTHRVDPGVARRFQLNPGIYYRVSNKGKPKYIHIVQLKRLKVEDYNMPVINR